MNKIKTSKKISDFDPITYNELFPNNSYIPVASVNQSKYITIDNIRGIKGYIGDVGDKGNKGDIGPTGLKGDTGDSGIDAPDIVGDKGNKGDVGPTGLKGDTGDSGIDAPDIVGDKGNKGDVGPTGLKGDTGDSGIDGVLTGLITPEMMASVTVQSDVIKNYSVTSRHIANGSVYKPALINTTWDINRISNICNESNVHEFFYPDFIVHTHTGLTRLRYIVANITTYLHRSGYIIITLLSLTNSQYTIWTTLDSSGKDLYMENNKSIIKQEYKTFLGSALWQSSSGMYLPDDIPGSVSGKIYTSSTISYSGVFTDAYTIITVSGRVKDGESANQYINADVYIDSYAITMY
jgi:hypothetical protein